MGPSYIYKATLIRVVDGDTVHMQVDLGYHIGVEIDFRLTGINAPEMKGATITAGKAAKAFLEGLLANRTDLVVVSVKTEKFGRWLGTIWFATEPTRPSANAQMVASGHAVVFMADPVPAVTP